MSWKPSLILIGLLMFSSAGLAQLPEPPDGMIVIELVPSTMGEEKFDAFGVAAKITKNGINQFVVKVSAQCPDGTLLNVRGYDAKGDAFTLGIIKMALSSGSLILKGSTELANESSMNKIRSVTVDHTLGVILKGDFY